MPYHASKTKVTLSGRVPPPPHLPNLSARNTLRCCTCHMCQSPRSPGQPVSASQNNTFTLESLCGFFLEDEFSGRGVVSPVTLLCVGIGGGSGGGSTALRAQVPAAPGPGGGGPFPHLPPRGSLQLWPIIYQSERSYCLFISCLVGIHSCIKYHCTYRWYGYSTISSVLAAYMSQPRGLEV